VIKQAFNLLLKLHSREVTITRPGGATATIRVSPSNYFRNLAGPGEVVVEGKEYVISKDILTSSGFTLPLKRGDRINDSEVGLIVISEIRELYNFGGQIIGYRVRSQ
jgi:hypothetical protein